MTSFVDPEFNRTTIFDTIEDPAAIRSAQQQAAYKSELENATQSLANIDITVLGSHRLARLLGVNARLKTALVSRAAFDDASKYG